MSRRTIALAGVGAALCVALGISVGTYVFAPPVPHSLAGSVELTSAMVSARSFDDERSVRVSVKLHESEPVLSPTVGRITALFLAPHASLVSGDKVMEVDGQPVVALHTASPLYRDITDGVEGRDIVALQEELGRLGYDIAVTGQVNWATRWALADVLGVDDVHGGVPELISRASIMWLPAESVTVNEVKVRTNDVLSESTILMTLIDQTQSGKISVPEGALPGARVLFYQDKSYPVADNGVIEDQELLAAIVASAQNLSAGAEPRQDNGDNTAEISVSIPWRLAEPLEVYVVSASALFGLMGNQGCIAGVDGNVHRVEVIASELGQTFITSDSSLGQVTLKTEGLQCQ